MFSSFNLSTRDVKSAFDFKVKRDVVSEVFLASFNSIVNAFNSEYTGIIMLKSEPSFYLLKNQMAPR